MTQSSNNNSVCIPAWLDNFIFNTLAAEYEPQNKKLVVLDWSKAEIQKYLGTYFPRSFAEALCIFSKYFFQRHEEYKNISELTLFDFGCGTGGEIVGFVLSISRIMPQIKKINVYAFDGNQHALPILERILALTASEICIDINPHILPIQIDDFCDMEILDNILTKKFDFIISFKSICEFITKQQLSISNPYKYFLDIFLPKLSNIGVMCIVDVSFFNCASNEWLPIMMDKAINSCDNVDIIDKNINFNECYYISHSRKREDISKVFWRILKPRG